MDLKKILNSNNITKIEDSFDVLAQLNSLLAEEFQAWYQYYVVAPFLFGNERTAVQELFNKNADDELNDHANLLINRINDLGGECILVTPETWRSVATLPFETALLDVRSQLELNIRAEQGAIEHYKSAIELAGRVNDITTQDILKKILADEEEHLAELNDFIKDLT